jgi:hypothetical protein
MGQFKIGECAHRKPYYLHNLSIFAPNCKVKSALNSSLDLVTTEDHIAITETVGFLPPALPTHSVLSEIV